MSKLLFTKIGQHLIPREDRKSYAFTGNKILVFGDLHLSNRKQAKHVDFERESLEAMAKIEQIVSQEQPSAIFLLGDLIGYADTVLTHGDFYTKVLNFFQDLNRQTHGHVFVVRGNHDMANRTEYDTLEGINYIKNPKQVDWFATRSKEKGEAPNMRFHIMNYGEYAEPIDKADSDETTDCVLGHFDYRVNGVTYWGSYDNDSDVLEEVKTYAELPELSNLKGVRLLISGHIHTSYLEGIDTNIYGEPITLFYLGCPTRASGTDDYDECGYAIAEVNSENLIEWTFESWQLRPLDEVFEEEVEKDDTTLSVEDSAKLDAIISQIGYIGNRAMTVQEQIDNLNFFSEGSREIAKEIYTEEYNKTQVKLGN